MSPEPDAAKAQAHFERAIAIALAQKAIARGDEQQARDLLAPVYGWFTEGFDTAVCRDRATAGRA